MKYSILAAFAESIPYIPGLRKLTGSVTSAILMARLEYHFETIRSPCFYKFLEPPETGHRDYRHGDSWTEELAFSKEEFRTAFDKIGTRYTSKTQYDKAKSIGSEFGDKFYCSCYDRRSGLTSYYRNHKKVNALSSTFKKGVA